MEVPPFPPGRLDQAGGLVVGDADSPLDPAALQGALELQLLGGDRAAGRTGAQEAEAASASPPLAFVNLREQAGWSTESAAAEPKMAALLAPPQCRCRRCRWCF